MCPQGLSPLQVLSRSSDERDSETNKQLLMALLNPAIVRPQHSLHLEQTLGPIEWQPPYSPSMEMTDSIFLN